MGKPDAPEPPDPRETSVASTSTNVGTAIANAWLGNVNQVTPDGTLTYDQTGSYEWLDPYTNKTYDVPTFTATQTYSPEQQAINEQNRAAQLNLSTLANEQSGFLQDYMAQPFDGGAEATESRLLELGRKRLDPMIAQQDEALRSRLANQGIKAGSEAYDREMGLQNQSENDAYNQLVLNGWGQSFSQAQAERNQPINEITALLSGSQVSQPQYASANMPTIPTTDVAGLINENYNQRMAGYQQESASRNSMLGGLLGFGGSLLSLSDERTKTDKKKVGSLDGHGLYEYRYKGEPKGTKHVGVMAQEVEKKRPDAVVKGEDGLRRVDYGALFKMGAK